MARIWISGIIGLAAVIDDLARRKISNWISISALLAGLILQIAEGGWRGGLMGLLGALTGGAVFAIFYVLGGMGGGDIKLMAGFGAILGANGILQASLWTAACGGIMAAGVIAINLLRRRLRGSKGAGESMTRVESIPYAPAIAAGVWLSMVAKA